MTYKSPNYHKENYQKNKEIIKAKSKEYYRNNKEAVKSRTRAYHLNNIEKMRAWYREYNRALWKDLSKRLVLSVRFKTREKFDRESKCAFPMCDNDDLVFHHWIYKLPVERKHFSTICQEHHKLIHLRGGK